MTLLNSRSAVFAVAGLALSISSALGHDEDYRKVLDRLAPVEGPVWRSGDPIPRGGGFNADGVTLLSQIPLNNFAPGNTQGNDCWGYVSPSGREYAIMGLERGFGFVEITNPTNPVVLTTIPGPQSIWHDVKVIGEYAYGVSEGGSGVQVMDLRQIDSGTVALVRNFTNGGQHQTTHNIVSNPEAGTLFLVGANIGNGGLINLDLTDPTRPTIDGGWTEMYVHDAQVVSYTEGPYAGREIAYLASGFNGGFSETGVRIVDVTDKNNMFTIATAFYANAAYSHQLWLSEDKQTLYVNDEIDELDGLVSVTTTRIFDVTDPANPQFVGITTSGRPAVDHNLYTHNNLMFQANYRSGLRIFDIGDPQNPTEIGFFDTFPNSDAATFNGAWSTFPYFPSGTVIVSDIERGLFVLRVDATPAARLRLTTPQGTPTQFAPEGGDELVLAISEIELETDGATVILNIDTGSGIEQVVGTLVAGNAGRYSFETPVLACDSSPRYWFSASSTSGASFTLPADAPSEAFEATVISGETLVFSDNFQTNQGWSVSGDAGDGQWNRGTPVGGGDRGDPGSDFDGSGACYLTDNVDGNSDVDDGSTILTSPALDASGSDPYLEYARWYNNTAGGSPGQDVFVVEISNNNGASWSNLETVGPNDGENSGGWVPVRFRLKDIFPNPSSQVRVRFNASDLGDGSVIEAGVDAVRVVNVECTDVEPTCLADYNGDGTVNVLDVVAFITVWNGAGEDADYNNDGNINVLDVVSFITVWNDGCP